MILKHNCLTFSKEQQIKSIFLIFSVVVLSLMVPQAFAISDSSPVDISYNNTSREIFIEWDFGDNTETEKCYSGVYAETFPKKIHEKSEWGKRYTIDCIGNITIHKDNFTIINYTQTEFRMNIKLIMETITPSGDEVTTLANITFIWSLDSVIELKDFEDDNYFNNPLYDYYIYYTYDIEKQKKWYPNDIIVLQDDLIDRNTKVKNGDNNKHKTKPTFGINHHTYKQIVYDGLVINNQIFTINDNFLTKIPMQYVIVGNTQNFTAKVYAPNTLKVMEFIFGISEVGKRHEAEDSVAFYFDYAGELQKIKGQNNIINFESINVTSSKVVCNPQHTTKNCTQVSMEMSFNEAPVGKIMALQAIDQTRRSIVTYFDEGLTISGKSLNDPVIKHIISKIKYKGLQTIQRIDKENNIWMSMDKNEPVLLYKQNEFGTFLPIEYRPKAPSSPDVITPNMDRNNSEYYKLMDNEKKRALAKFNSTEIQSRYH